QVLGSITFRAIPILRDVANGYGGLKPFGTNGSSSCQNTSWLLKLTMPASFPPPRLDRDI
ncbi:MAG: hypothetical protein ABI833_21215, partial [Acidobacteriota bacterium]